MSGAGKLLAIPRVPLVQNYKMVYNGTNEFATLPSINLGTGAFTIELFIKMLRATSYNSIELLIGNETGNLTGLFMESNALGGSIYGYIGNTSFIGYGTWTRTDAGNTNFYHYVLQRNSDSNGQLKVNGLNRATNNAISGDANFTPNIAKYGIFYSNIEVYSVRISDVARYGTDPTYLLPNPDSWVADANTLFLSKPVKRTDNVLENSGGTLGNGTVTGVTNYNIFYQLR